MKKAHRDLQYLSRYRLRKRVVQNAANVQDAVRHVHQQLIEENGGDFQGSQQDDSDTHSVSYEEDQSSDDKEEEYVRSDDGVHGSPESDEEEVNDAQPNERDDGLDSSPESDEGENSNPHQNERNDIRGNRPLYFGATVTILQSMCLIFALALKHNLTSSCISDVLEVVNLLCPQQELFRNSIYKFQNFFSISTLPIQKIYYCSNCYSKLTDSVDNCEECQGRHKTCYFVQLPLVPQVQEMFRRPGFWNFISSRFERQKCNNDCLEDIYDGALYREQMDAGFFSSAANISFLWNGDGVPVFASKPFSIWPFFLAINELPFKLRFVRENILLAGLWFGCSQPKVNLFCQSFRSDFMQLYRGVRLFISDLQQSLRVRAVLLAGTCDLPAKSKFLNVKQFNGDYGCPCCEEKGESFQLGLKSFTHVYRYVRSFTLRTLHDTIDKARIAIDSGDDVKGVKGPSYLQHYMPDYIKGMGIDLMHLLSGIVKKLLNLQFGEKYSREPFSLRAFSQPVNERLLNIKPPKFVHRMPRSVLEVCHWKASELKLWLFYYSPVVLRGIMRPDFYAHHMKLVLGLAYLSASHISPTMIRQARQVLHEFVQEFELMYGLRHCSITLHLLLHLPETVNNLGPLWCYTCFPFENLNGQFLKGIHGTRFVDSQVCNNHWQVLSSAKRFWSLPDGDVRNFCKYNRRQCRILDYIASGCYAVGTYTYSEEGINEPFIQNALRLSNRRGRGLKFFRLLKDGSIYVSEGYSRDLQTTSSFCMYQSNNDENPGNILSFVKVFLNCVCHDPNCCQCPVDYIALVRDVIVQNVFSIDRLNASLDYMTECRIGDRVRAVPVDRLNSVCFYLYAGNQSYVAKPVNNMEVE